jgi:biopolymer transport protein ExbB/TolQ
MSVLEWLLAIAVVVELSVIIEQIDRILKYEKLKEELANEINQLRNLYRG